MDCGVFLWRQCFWTEWWLRSRLSYHPISNNCSATNKISAMICTLLGGNCHKIATMNSRSALKAGHVVATSHDDNLSCNWIRDSKLDKLNNKWLWDCSLGQEHAWKAWVFILWCWCNGEVFMPKAIDKSPNTNSNKQRTGEYSSIVVMMWSFLTPVICHTRWWYWMEEEEPRQLELPLNGSVSAFVKGVFRLLLEIHWSHQPGTGGAQTRYCFKIFYSCFLPNSCITRCSGQILKWLSYNLHWLTPVSCWTSSGAALLVNRSLVTTDYY